MGKVIGSGRGESESIQGREQNDTPVKLEHALKCRRCLSGDLLEDDPMAQALQLLDMPARGLLPIALLEIRSPQLLLRDLVLEQVIDDDQDRMRDSHNRLLVSPMAHDPAIPSRQPAVFHPNRGQRRLRQREVGSDLVLCTRSNKDSVMHWIEINRLGIFLIISLDELTANRPPGI